MSRKIQLNLKLKQNINPYALLTYDNDSTADSLTACRTRMADMSIEEWSSRIRLFPITERPDRHHRRNLRDPRLQPRKSAPAPIRLVDEPRLIPLDYDPVVDAKAPQRTKRPLQAKAYICLLYTSPSPRDRQKSRMPSSA